MPVSVSQFTVSVILTKLVHRQGSEAASNAQPIDLTPYFGLNGAIRVSKNVRDPNGTGGFSLAFADRISASYGDTLYALIEPMDMIEIRASRTPLAATPALLMRGFVSSVRRSESMAADGTPQRSVIVMGQDSGKLIQQCQILWEYAASTGEPYLAQFASLTANGIPVEQTDVSAFMEAIVANVINPKIAALNVFANSQVKPFRCQATVPEGAVISQQLAPIEGSIWGVMSRVADLTWNELFVQDTESGPVVVFRPVPFRDITSSEGGSYIMPGATDPGTIDLYDFDVVSIDVSRTDAGVANLFWVDPGQNILNTNFGTAVGNLAAGTMLATSPANSPALYGERMMRAPTGLVAAESQPPYQATPAPLTGPAAFVQARKAELGQLNHNNVLFESGSMVVKGSEALIPGQYLKFFRGGTTSISYLYAVDHNIAPLATWTTTLSIDRGNGFYQRDQSRQGWGWLEGRSGPYSPLPSTTSAAA